MSLNNPSVAIVGATGAVGTELIACLEQRDFPLRSLRLFASPRSAGRRLMFRGDGLPVEAADARMASPRLVTRRLRTQRPATSGLATC